MQHIIALSAIQTLQAQIFAWWGQIGSKAFSSKHVIGDVGANAGNYGCE